MLFCRQPLIFTPHGAAPTTHAAWAAPWFSFLPHHRARCFTFFPPRQHPAPSLRSQAPGFWQRGHAVCGVSAFGIRPSALGIRPTAPHRRLGCPRALARPQAPIATLTLASAGGRQRHLGTAAPPATSLPPTRPTPPQIATFHAILAPVRLSDRSRRFPALFRTPPSNPAHKRLSFLSLTSALQEQPAVARPRRAPIAVGMQRHRRHLHTAALAVHTTTIALSSIAAGGRARFACPTPPHDPII